MHSAECVLFAAVWRQFERISEIKKTHYGILGLTPALSGFVSSTVGGRSAYGGRGFLLTPFNSKRILLHFWAIKIYRRPQALARGRMSELSLPQRIVFSNIKDPVLKITLASFFGWIFPFHPIARFLMRLVAMAKIRSFICFVRINRRSAVGNEALSVSCG